MGDSNPQATFGYVAEQLGKRGIAFIFTRESLGEIRISPELKKRFGGVLIANEGFNRETAQQVIAAGEADAVSFGKDFIGTPDLPRRLQLNVALNPYHPETFYGYGVPDPRTGYTDYPSVVAEIG
jgi:N-ethylmaleimide reductase